ERHASGKGLPGCGRLSPEPGDHSNHGAIPRHGLRPDIWQQRHPGVHHGRPLAKRGARDSELMEGTVHLAGIGKRVRVYIGEQDKAAGHHEPLWETILELLRAEGAAGATLFRGLAGFGAHSKLHMARLADLAPDLPLLVEWIDGPERVDRLL